jgi:molybdate transport system permease protein
MSAWKSISPPSPSSLEVHPPARSRQLWPVQVLSIPMLAFFILPLLALLLRTSPASLLANLRQPVVLQAIGLSLATSLTATLITVLLGTPLAYGLARNYFRHGRLLDTVVDMPIVLPPAVAGVALLMAFGRRGVLGGLLGGLGIDIAFTTTAVVMAQVFIAAPFYIKSARLGFAGIDRELEQSAGLDGANRWQVFRYVVSPLSWTALLGGSVMTWARAMGEFGATILFAGNFPGRTQTMPLAIYIGFELDLNVALTLSVILVGFSFLVLMLVKGLLHREVATA